MISYGRRNCTSHSTHKSFSPKLLPVSATRIEATYDGKLYWPLGKCLQLARERELLGAFLKILSLPLSFSQRNFFLRQSKGTSLFKLALQSQFDLADQTSPVWCPGWLPSSRLR